jgi:hypothetical protein
VVRAGAFTNGWTPSVAAAAYYGPPAATANVQVTRSIIMTNSTAPVVAFSVTPGTNATCVAVTETLPPGLSAANVNAGGNYIASNDVVVWGPFFGTNAQTLSYQAVGQPGGYPVQASWSVDGVGGGETNWTQVVITTASGNLIPTAPPQVASPTFAPASGANVPVSVAIADATPGAVVYYTLDGSLPTPASLLYTGAVQLASAGVIRAVGVMSNWLPSAANVAYYGPPAPVANVQVTRSVTNNSSGAPWVTFNVTPGAGASCVAVTETLPPGLGATTVSAGGNYVASNNVVLWGPFFGTNAQALSYQVVGQPGTYSVQASWSVDGVGGGETNWISLVIPGPVIPTPPAQEPMPTLAPASASSLPVAVSISCGDPQAQIYYTTDGTLPTQTSTNSLPYAGPVVISAQTALRAVAFRPGYLPSVAALGEYVPALPASPVSAAQSVSGNGTSLPTVSLTATPESGVSCYAVVEAIPPGLAPLDLSGDGSWDPIASEIRWGPYLDDQPRVFSFDVAMLPGTYTLSGQVSADGYSVATSTELTGPAEEFPTTQSGLPPPPNPTGCAALVVTYSFDIEPCPGVITVTSATGTVSWGDGTTNSVTQPIMTLEHGYTNAGTFLFVLSVGWTGYMGSVPASGFVVETSSIQVIVTCAPVIVTQPTNQVVLAGSNAQFAVTAASPVTMGYQWYFNTNSAIRGAVFPTLSLPETETESAGFYSVVVTNANGGVTSRLASLTVAANLITSVTQNADGSVTLTFCGLPNSAVRLLAATNLVTPIAWSPIATNSNLGTNGVWEFTDTNAPALPARFYRFSTP